MGMFFPDKMDWSTYFPVFTKSSYYTAGGMRRNRWSVGFVRKDQRCSGVSVLLHEPIQEPHLLEQQGTSHVHKRPNRSLSMSVANISSISNQFIIYCNNTKLSQLIRKNYISCVCRKLIFFSEKDFFSNQNHFLWSTTWILPLKLDISAHPDTADRKSVV